jgi:hypothetical protein
MSERANHKLRGIAAVSLLLAAGACLALWLVRIYYAISFVTPYMMTTTNCEEESIFSVWKFTQHQAIYSDIRRIPFAYSCYNWAYYSLYGLIAKTSLYLLHLDAIWIPTIGRLITVAFTLLAGAVCYLAMRRFVTTGFFANRFIAWAWVIIATVGPLEGFWSISFRSDLGALAFEAVGLYVILCYLKKPDLRLILATALLFYAAWAFKQSSVTMLTGSVLTLLLLRRWRAFLALSGIWWLLVIVTLAVGSPEYRESILFSQRYFPISLHNALEYSSKVPHENIFLLLCLAVIFAWLWRNFRQLASKPVEAALTLVVCFSACFAFITSFKIGSDDNYFIPAAWAAMLCFAVMMEQVNARWVLAGLVLCSGLMIAEIARNAWRSPDYYNPRGEDPTYRAIAEKLSHLPGPAMVTDRYANLPWVQRFSPHFVVGFAYDDERAAGVPFEEGGWQGLAGEGYFATLVIDSDYNYPPYYAVPPSMLQKYKLVDEYSDKEADYKFYRRMDSDSPGATPVRSPAPR